ncbi:MAG: DUF167 domain-containing protein [Nitrospirae bacterium]|nr:DUF167 domain-containing protein [Nitrospirota bacterium]MBI3352018.1 DUF167 domain-containing protein [Nitrospirota bacterium]
MKISVKVKPNAKTEKIGKISESEFTASVKAPPHDGKANTALIALLADYFNVPKNRITLLKGSSSKQKLIEIL